MSYISTDSLIEQLRKLQEKEQLQTQKIPFFPELPNRTKIVPTITEEDVRRIIREELKKLVNQ